MEPQWETLSPDLRIAVSLEHRFGTDAFLLSDFSLAKRRDRVVDLGAGCGIIPFLIYKMYCPKIIYGLEIQPSAFSLFSASVEASGLEEKVIPVLGDLREKVLSPDAFDLVTCNPPYQRASHGIHSPNGERSAARHELLATIEDVCKAAGRLLKTGGRLCICQRPERLCDAIEAMRKAGMEPKRLRFAAKEPGKAPWLFLLEGKKGASPFLRVEPTLYLYQGEEYTLELLQIYRKEQRDEG